MKIAEGRLRSIIRDMILSEAPLVGDGIYRYETSPEEDKEIDSKLHNSSILTADISSISYKQSKSPSWRDEAHVLMRNTPDMWAIITASRADLFNFGKKDLFNQWLSEQNIPKGTRILAIGSASFSGDYESVAWVIGHDILGHSMMQHIHDGIQSTKGARKPTPWDMVWIHNRLPLTSKISFEHTDFLPDIYAAIFLKSVEREYFDEHVLTITNNDMRNDMNYLLDEMFKNIDDWITSIPIDKPYVIKPW
jgi:hypothetical protein